MPIKSGSLGTSFLSYDFSFDERVNLFIGPNASGKTTILRLIEDIYSLAYEGHGLEESPNLAMAGYEANCLEVSDDWPRDDVDPMRAAWYKVPLLYIPATRVALPGMSIYDDTIDKVDNGGADNPLRVPVKWEVGEDGLVDEYYESTDDPLVALFDTSSGVFNGYYLEQAIYGILNNLSLYKRPRDRTPISDRRGFSRDQLSKALEVGYLCAKSICTEVIRGDAPRNYGEVSSAGGATRLGMGIMVSDNVLADPLYAGALSSGTQSTLLWVWALALKISLHYLWENDWETKPAILLIDEIENHLHPTWQRRVIPALLDHFPGLQIFATTHSPFVVAGLKAGQVHLLRRDPETGATSATTNTEDIIGWTADEILRNMMGVDEPTDQLTVDRANRLRDLREKEPLTLEEEAELNGLRRQVNQDFLNKSGPLEAQRERYADLMQRFLLSQRPELTQDGG